MTEAHKPTVGRIVLFKSTDTAEIGDGSAQEVPAIITNVWSDICVNLMVMRDGWQMTPACVTSVMHESTAGGSHSSWRWPDRV